MLTGLALLHRLTVAGTRFRRPEIVKVRTEQRGKVTVHYYE